MARMITSHHRSAPIRVSRSPRQEALAKIKSEVVRIGTNGTRQGFKFAEAMFQAYPELRGA